MQQNEAEKLAAKEGLMFFEVSAKTNETVQKMFFTAVAELPFFEQFEFNDKKKLIDELENENRGGDTLDNSILDIVKHTKKGLEVQGARDNTASKAGCKC